MLIGFTKIYKYFGCTFQEPSTRVKKVINKCTIKAKQSKLP